MAIGQKLIPVKRNKTRLNLYLPYLEFQLMPIMAVKIHLSSKQ